MLGKHGPFASCARSDERDTYAKYYLKKIESNKMPNMLAHGLAFNHLSTVYRMHLYPRTLQLPEMKPLQSQLKAFYEMNGLKPAEEQIYREAWGIKHACGLVKRKGRRGEPTRDTWLQDGVYNESFVCISFILQSAT